MNQLVGASCGAAGATNLTEAAKTWTLWHVVNDFKAVESLLVENCYTNKHAQTSRANKVSMDPKS